MIEGFSRRILNTFGVHSRIVLCNFTSHNEGVLRGGGSKAETPSKGRRASSSPSRSHQIFSGVLYATHENNMVTISNITCRGHDSEHHSKTVGFMGLVCA